MSKGKRQQKKMRNPLPPRTSFFFIGVLLLCVGTINIGINIFLANLLPSVADPVWSSAPRAEEKIYGDDDDDQEPRFVFQEGPKEPMVNISSFIEEGQRDVLHVVTTRFMQHQPNLLALGKARMRQFETFCLPSMLGQVMKSYIWFVMIDPDLDVLLLRRLKELLEPHPNYFLIRSNDKLITPPDIRNATIRNGIVTGDLHLLDNLMFDPNRPLLLETRLDADDGLHRHTLSQIQIMARSMPKTDEQAWRVICMNLHFEWRNDDIMRLNQSDVSSGKLRLVAEDMCVTPGYTLLIHRRPPQLTDFPPWPRIGHHLVNRFWPVCSDENSNKKTNITRQEMIVLPEMNYTVVISPGECYLKLPKYPAALRSRAVTSAGMNRVADKPQQNDSQYDEQTRVFWGFVENDYGITPQAAKSTSQYLKRHLKEIAEDNLKGQCTFGHSCKQSTKEKLESFINATFV